MDRETEGRRIAPDPGTPDQARPPVVGVDTGGTFTDLVVGSGPHAGTVVKVPSTPSAPGDAVRSACTALASRPRLLAHGTTVATNALLERRLGRVALVTTRGFADVIEIARQARPSLYDQHVDRPVALVARELRFEVGGRLAADGVELEAWDGRLPGALRDALARRAPRGARGLDAVAVCLLHSDLNPAHELAVAGAVRDRGGSIRVVCSHEVSPEFREYERMVTTVVDAALAPVCVEYLEHLDALAREVLVMTSAGGLAPLARGARHPASLLVSGPAAGVRAAAEVARACGFPDAVSFDMGGTSTDVCLVRGGVPEPAPSLVVGGYPIRLPALAVHTIGAGGGSIARVDAGGALVVGPESAGARPGPAAYGHGGSDPTVTDADVVLGRIPADAPLPGIGTLDVDAARAALDRLDLGAPHAAATGTVRVVDAAMQRAVRAVTVEQGVDPRALALVAFGGAGPLHACAIADGLGMRAVIVPPRAGVLSAVGLLCSPRQEELVQSWMGRVDARDDRLDDAMAQLATSARRRLGTEDAAVQPALDCRYAGQSHELTVDFPDSGASLPRPRITREQIDARFAAEHVRRNGYARPGTPVEVVALRVRASLAAPLTVADLPVVERARVVGPRVVAEADCTVWVPPGWVAETGPLGAWVIARG